MWSNVVWVCSSFWSSVMTNFPSCSHHAIGKKVGPPKNFNSVGIHRSQFEFGALGLVLIISSSSELRIVHHFFYGLLILQGTFCQNFKKKFLNQLNRFPKLQFRQNSLKQVRIRSTWACFDHISLI